MKKIKNLVALTLCAMAVVFTACKTDQPDVFGKPVVDKDFTVKVVGNNVFLSCTNTTVTSALWQVSNGVQKTNKKDTLYLPVAGDYNVVLSVSNGGDYVSADTVKFTVASSDAAFFNTGILKDITGGAGTGAKKKTWILDLAEVVTTFIDDAGVVTTNTTHKSSYFHNPLDFYGDATAGGSATNVWGPWGGTDIYGWGGTPETGSITFDATSGKCTLTLDGVSTTGSYGVTTYARPADFCTITANNNNGTPISLWDNMLTGKYSYLRTLSAQMADIKFAPGLRFPMDKGRITNDANATYPSQFLKSDLENVTIIHASDSALVVRVKRTYEGDKESKCWLLYNFIVKEYNYPTAKTYTHPVKNTTIAAGTYKLAPVPGNWIGWATKDVLNNLWVSRAVFRTDMINWWQFGDPAGASTASNADIAMGALDGTQLVFGTDGKVAIHNSIYKDGAVSATDLTTTYSVNKGYITFGDSIQVYAVAPSLPKLKHAYIVDVASSQTNLWIGYNNGTKEETQAIQLVKQ
ncbi:MAG: hypothetical protein PHR83_03435 [Paludibacter sp.]|nr:hypothetical protein [Paludibacter sp.]